MTPYYEDNWVTIYHADCRDFVHLEGVVVTDPPYNVGYKYDTYEDSLTDGDYLDLIEQTCRLPSVVIHYPEDIINIAARLGIPQKCVAWVYNSPIPRQFRLVGWFGLRPDLSLEKQPYKNPTDARVARHVRETKSTGRALYDWWHIQQVKNVSGEKTSHPCQIPLSVMRRVVGVTPAQTIIDPFAGSGTTLRAAKDYGRQAIGIEIDERYCEIAAQRCSQEVLELGMAFA